jgi:hypothetical protein
MKNALKCLLLFVLLVFPFVAEGGDASIASVVYLKQDIVKTAKKYGREYELWLKVPNENKFEPFLETRSGTGVLVSIENRPYLLTASHVAKQLTPSAHAVICGPGDKPLPIVLSDLVGSTAEFRWTVNPSADVAVLPITTADLNVLKKLEEHCISISVFVSTQTGPQRDLNLTVLGFPLNLGIGGYFSPISKTSRAASGLLSLPRFDTQTQATFFLLEDPSIGGFSGAPVFLKPGIQAYGSSLGVQKGFTYYGIVHGTLSDPIGGKLAAIIPAQYVVETLRQADTDSSLIRKTGQQVPGEER